MSQLPSSKKKRVSRSATASTQTQDTAKEIKPFEWTHLKLSLLCWGYLRPHLSVGLKDIATILFIYIKSLFAGFNIYDSSKTTMTYWSNCGNNKIICTFKDDQTGPNRFSTDRKIILFDTPASTLFKKTNINKVGLSVKVNENALVCQCKDVFFYKYVLGLVEISNNRTNELISYSHNMNHMDKEVYNNIVNKIKDCNQYLIFFGNNYLSYGIGNTSKFTQSPEGLAQTPNYKFIETENTTIVASINRFGKLIFAKNGMKLGGKWGQYELNLDDMQYLFILQSICCSCDDNDTGFQFEVTISSS